MKKETKMPKPKPINSSRSNLKQLFSNGYFLSLPHFFSRMKMPFISHN